MARGRRLGRVGENRLDLSEAMIRVAKAALLRQRQQQDGHRH
jgi:hypothetical protein